MERDRADDDAARQQQHLDRAALWDAIAELVLRDRAAGLLNQLSRHGDASGETVLAEMAVMGAA